MHSDPLSLILWPLALAAAGGAARLSPEFLELVVAELAAGAPRASA